MINIEWRVILAVCQRVIIREGGREIVALQPRKEALRAAPPQPDQIGDAIEVLSPLASGPDAQLDAQTALAGLYERASRWKDAAAMWGIVAAKSPDPSNRMQQASALLNAGNVSEGRDVLLALAKDRPQDASVWYLLAQAERRSGNPGGAEDAAKRITDIDANDPRGRLALAEAKEARHDFAGVVETLLPLYESRRSPVRPNDDVFGFVGMTLANAYEELAQFDRAEQILRELIARNATDDVALNALGYMLADRGQKLDEAVSFIKRALAVDPASSSYLDSLGWAYLKQGEAAEAVPPLEQAAK
ncbi:MAG: hypothetical protein B7X11_01885, partial [Acidobacteria bacterium 37-65-4]